MSAAFGVGVRPISAGGVGFPVVAPIPVVCGEWLDCSAGDIRLGVCNPAFTTLADVALGF